MHEGHRNRKREHAIKCGLENMETHEILEMILYYSIPRGDTNPIAHNLIERFGSFAGVLDAERSELCEVEGIGPKSAFMLKLFTEAFRRYEITSAKKRINIGFWEDLEEYVKSLFVGKKMEQFYCICVSSGKNVVSTRLMKSGYADNVEVTVGDVVKEALARNVKSVIIAHNHPYSKAIFSGDDIKFTMQLIEGLRMVDIELIDHLVVSGDVCTSYFKSCC